MAERGTTSRKTLNTEERAALKEYMGEKRKGKTTPEEDAQAVVEKIETLPEPDRGLAAKVHEIALKVAPELAPKLWYGMPAYYLDGKNLMWFQPGSKFKARYGFIGFSDKAALDDGDLFPVSWGLTGMSAKVEKELGELIRRAIG